jgi:ferredoxin-NAD(P)+ reductase (naphthalene dioxygenase ferredoxin-specific)
VACRAFHLSDCEVSPVGQDETVSHPHRSMNTKITDITTATHDIRIVRMEISLGEIYDFAPGQYSSLTFNGMPPRDFSMANVPGKSELEFHIRQVANGEVSGHVLSNLKIGDSVQVEGPYGVSYLRASHSGPIIALAGSTGLAPIKCIVESALGKGIKQGIYLYFGVRTPKDLYLAKELHSLSDSYSNLTFVPVISESTESDAYRTGLVADAVINDFDDLDGCKSYIAGPPVMVEDAVRKFELLGMQREDCHADAFYTEADKAKLDEKEQ